MGVEVLEALEYSRYDVNPHGHTDALDDDIETTLAIRRRWHAEDQPKIIAMAACAVKGDRERRLNVGMDDYLVKPVQISELERALYRYRGP